MKESEFFLTFFNGIFHYLLDNIVQYKNITIISDLQNLLLIRH